VDQRLEHRRLPRLKVIGISEARVGLAGFLECGLELLQLVGEPVMVSFTTATAASARSTATACGVNPTPPRSARSSSLAAIAAWSSASTPFFHS
jgi:hypothetical protein